MEKKWQSALGEVTKFSELDHQYLSNILWFNEVLKGWTRKDKVQNELELELMNRFNGVRLLWKPLPLPSCRNLQDQTEIYWIKRFASIDKEGRIFWKERLIGNISHIWK